MTVGFHGVALLIQLHLERLNLILETMNIKMTVVCYGLALLIQFLFERLNLISDTFNLAEDNFYALNHTFTLLHIQIQY